MKTKKWIITICCLISGFLMGTFSCTHRLSDVEIANYNTLLYKVEMIKAYNDYYNHVEILLDSISETVDSFEDTVMETDTYFDYEVSRSKVWYLQNMKDNPDSDLKKYKEFCDSMDKL